MANNNTNNYEIAKKRAQDWFLGYDQEKMIQKFSLPSDAAYIYIIFFHTLFRIQRVSGLVEYLYTKDRGIFWMEADFNAALTIYDVLCESAEDCKLAGTFTKIDNLNRVMAGSKEKILCEDNDSAYEKIFDRNPKLLEKLLEEMGGRRMDKGDVSMQIDVFPFLPVWVQFWYSDDEFPASLNILWDANATQFMHFETLWYAMGYLLRTMKERFLELEEEEANAEKERERDIFGFTDEEPDDPFQLF